MATSIQDELWELLNRHPDFGDLNRTDRERAYAQLESGILDADVSRPLSIDRARKRMDAIFNTVGLDPSRWK